MKMQKNNRPFLDYLVHCPSSYNMSFTLVPFKSNLFATLGVNFHFHYYFFFDHDGTIGLILSLSLSQKSIEWEVPYFK